MKLTAKLTGALALAMMAVLAVNAWVRLEREVGLFESGMRRHAHVFGHALANDVGWAWRTAGEAQALELVVEANEKYSDLDVRWVWLRDDAPAPYRPRFPLASLDAVSRGQELNLRLPEDSGPGELFTYVPVKLPTAEAERCSRHAERTAALACRDVVTF